jgi:hypothetical protein
MAKLLPLAEEVLATGVLMVRVRRLSPDFVFVGSDVTSSELEQEERPVRATANSRPK